MAMAALRIPVPYRPNQNLDDGLSWAVKRYLGYKNPEDGLNCAVKR